ncbi:hypothetical protein SO802_034170 [Lithocarpus litseifolius]|uniref:Bifunctional inhibitor/plant lipid transfer protein/seed storage helical domain-containing protein n=1 Tax=Lithocarpus litseifolius TaxID=425828 RepID=A0AAW2BKV0_9ROSI
MASTALASTALLLSLNLLFFTMVSSTYVPCPPPPSKGHKHPAPSKNPPSTAPPKNPPSTAPPKKPPSTAPPKNPPSTKPTCPKDTLKLGVCANLLNDLIHLVVGTPPNTPCCSLIGGLADLEAAVCLCTAIKANVLGINLNVPLSLSLLLNFCGKKVSQKRWDRVTEFPIGEALSRRFWKRCNRATLSQRFQKRWDRSLLIRESSDLSQRFQKRWDRVALLQRFQKR